VKLAQLRGIDLIGKPCPAKGERYAKDAFRREEKRMTRAADRRSPLLYRSAEPMGTPRRKDGRGGGERPRARIDLIPPEEKTESGNNQLNGDGRAHLDQMAVKDRPARRRRGNRSSKPRDARRRSLSNRAKPCSSGKG